MPPRPVALVAHAPRIEPPTGAAVTTALVLLHYALVLLTSSRAMLRPHREPAARIAWIAVILAVPYVGTIAYLLFGEVRTGRAHAARVLATFAALPAPTGAGTDAGTDGGGDGDHDALDDVPACWHHLFRTGGSINGFPAVGGNSAAFLAEPDAFVDALVADIDAAREHVHVLFYIWLDDATGGRVADALERAAGRGVPCRAVADDVGSRGFIRGGRWAHLRAAGVRVHVALPVGNLLVAPLLRRMDVRTHRKIVVVDGRIAYCGSRNCADPAFLPKARYAPWVDVMVRYEGPVAVQHQHLFAREWMAGVDEDLSELLTGDVRGTGAAVAQVIATGPTARHSAMPEMFETLMHAAREELAVTTPYYVPNEAMHSALCAASRRGVLTTLVVPARNDSRIVAGASRSYYAELLDAGVRVREFEGGLLHAKTLVVDRAITLVGSANMDRRSFDLNYENNVLTYDPALAAAVRARQRAWEDGSREVTRAEVAAWRWPRRMLDNGLALLGPVL